MLTYFILILAEMHFASDLHSCKTTFDSTPGYSFKTETCKNGQLNVSTMASIDDTLLDSVKIIRDSEFKFRKIHTINHSSKLESYKSDETMIFDIVEGQILRKGKRMTKKRNNSIYYTTAWMDTVKIADGLIETHGIYDSLEGHSQFYGRGLSTSGKSMSGMIDYTYESIDGSLSLIKNICGVKYSQKCKANSPKCESN